MQKLTTRGRRLLAVAVTVPALVVPAAVLTATTAAAAAAPTVGSKIHDLLAVGRPDRDQPGAPRAGSVDVYFPDGRKQTLTEKVLGLGATRYGRFGASIVVTDLNHDGRPDLVVGAPGVPGHGLAGHVDLLIQSDHGFAAGYSTPINGVHSGDEFGAALAVTTLTGGPKIGNLWVGAPGSDQLSTGTSTASNAGVVCRFKLAANGDATLSDTVSEDDLLGVSQLPEKNDRFGEVLAPNVTGVVVGVPHEDIGKAVDAGEVAYIQTDRDNNLTKAVVVSQNSPGVPGVAQSGDHFGAAVSRYGVLIGVPGEHVGKKQDAGTVQVIASDGFSTRGYTAGGSFSQNSPGIPGRAEAGDRFGAAISVGFFRCYDAYQFAIGSPGEDVGRTKNAGSVTVTYVDGLRGVKGCASRVLTQGSARGLLGGSAETGDSVGSSIGTVPGGPDTASGSTRLDALVVGVPGEDVGPTTNAGRATLWSGHGRGYRVTVGPRGGDRAGLGFGRVFGVPSIDLPAE